MNMSALRFRRRYLRGGGVPGGGGGGAQPSLDFSEDYNSQYIGQVV